MQPISLQMAPRPNYHRHHRDKNGLPNPVEHGKCSELTCLNARKRQKEEAPEQKYGYKSG